VAEFQCDVSGSRPPPKITWHVHTSGRWLELSSTRTALIDPLPSPLTAPLDLGITINNIDRSRDLMSADSADSGILAIGREWSADRSTSDANAHSPSASSLYVKSNVMLSNHLISPVYTIDFATLSQDGNTSSSTLRLRMRRDLHQAQLVCRASNFELPSPDNQLQDDITLDVLCK
jgi:hypothetical protein